MTPAINLAKKQKIAFTTHQYQHDTNASSYGMEAVEKLGLEQGIVFKTLVVELDSKQFIVAVIPVAEKLSMKLIAKAAKAKKAAMAPAPAVKRSTGYLLGGVSPLGQKKRLPTFIDNSAQSLPKMYISAGRRGLEIALAPNDLKQLTNATFSELTS